MRKPLNQPGWELGLTHHFLRSCDIVLDTVPGGHTTIRIDAETRRPGVVVTWLPYTTRIQDKTPAGSAQLDLGRSDDSVRLNVAPGRLGENRRHVSVANQA